MTPPQPPWVALERDTLRRRLVGWMIALVLITVVTVAGLLGWQELKIRSVTAGYAWLSSSEDGGRGIDTVVLGRDTWVYYHATLIGAPDGRRIGLACKWIDPRWVPSHVVEYETRRVDKSPWPTHCRHRFEPDMEPGPWAVRLYAGDRLIRETHFDVVRRSE